MPRKRTEKRQPVINRMVPSSRDHAVTVLEQLHELASQQVVLYETEAGFIRYMHFIYFKDNMWQLDDTLRDKLTQLFKGLPTL